MFAVWVAVCVAVCVVVCVADSVADKVAACVVANAAVCAAIGGNHCMWCSESVDVCSIRDKTRMLTLAPSENFYYCSICYKLTACGAVRVLTCVSYVSVCVCMCACVWCVCVSVREKERE